MAWQIDTRDINRVRSFSEAAKVWAAATPWKNELTSWRPLAGRRMRHKRIVQVREGKGYQCILYCTAIVTYLGNGRVELRCHDSISTTAFADRVSPAGCSAVSARGRMFWEVRTDEGTRFYREGREPLLLKPTPKGNWLLISMPDDVHEMVNDNAKRREVRKRIKPYADWHKVTERLMGDAMPKSPSFLRPADAVNALPLLDQPENYMRIVERLGTPLALTDALYAATGAAHRAPVPHDRLPRNYA